MNRPAIINLLWILLWIYSGLTVDLLWIYSKFTKFTVDLLWITVNL